RAVVARPGRDDAERYLGLRDDVHPEVDDPVAAHDHEGVEPLADRAPRCRSRLLGRRAREVHDLVPPRAQLGDRALAHRASTPPTRRGVHDHAEGAHEGPVSPSARATSSLRAARRAARLSCSAHTPTAAKYSPQIGIARANIEMASAVGVATAAKTNASSTAQRHPANHARALTMPVRLRPTMTTGKRKASPNARTMRMMNVR